MTIEERIADITKDFFLTENEKKLLVLKIETIIIQAKLEGVNSLEGKL